MAENLLTYSKSKYLYISLGLLAICIVLYFSQSGIEGSNGGTPQGYALGTVGALLIFWLAALGIRKRSFTSQLGKVKAWVSAHVYLGTCLILIGALHSAFQVGFNIHTLAYVLTIIVVLSGIYGVFTYLSYPKLISTLSEGRNPDEQLVLLLKLREQIEGRCNDLDGELQMIVRSAIGRTDLGRSNIDLLRGKDLSAMLQSQTTSSGLWQTNIVPNPDQQPLLDFVAKRIPTTVRNNEAEVLLGLLDLLTRRQQLLRNFRQAQQLKARSVVWLYAHVPLSIGLMVALIIHIISVFFYW